MKEKFFAFYNDIDNIETVWNNDKTLFVFDTNVLLDLYSFKDSEVEYLINILERLKDKIWIPYHVGLEFNLKRLSIIKGRKNTLKSMESEISNLNKIIDVKIDKKLLQKAQSAVSFKKNYPRSHTLWEKLNKDVDHIHEKIRKIISDEIEPVVDKMLKDFLESNGKALSVNSRDTIREKIDSIFSGSRIGEDYFNTQDKLNILYEEGEKRFNNEIPPGYKDKNKDKDSDQGIVCYNGLSYKRKYGDLLIFKSIIEFSKTNDIDNVIFITNDQKEDWVEKIHDEGEKTIGPRIELKLELKNEAGIDLFEILDFECFLQQANNILDINNGGSLLSGMKRSLKENKKNYTSKIISKNFFTSNFDDENDLFISKDFYGKFDKKELISIKFNILLDRLDKIEEYEEDLEKKEVLVDLIENYTKSRFASDEIKRSASAIISFCKKQDGVNISQTKEILRYIFDMRIDEL